MKTTILVIAGVLLVPSARADENKVDPAATRLLAEARANRACWERFPGFTADIEVNLDGKISRGQVEVEPSGKVRYLNLDKDAQQWARSVLNSAVSHRMPSNENESPCEFMAADENHPLGRAVRLLDNSMHSIYRIRDKQITVVDRRIEKQRFTISMQENTTNTEGKYLPVSYTIQYWNLISGELERSEAHFQGWKRIDRFDLPVTVRVVAAMRATPKAHNRVDGANEALTTRSLTLSNHKLTSQRVP